ncbi:hypothetical protein OA492_00535 [Pelagibacteraceae bacterium]|nr:hypothetical protein [Pelagibacteraceae bacterium]
MHKIYKLLSYFLIPIIILNLYFRIISKKEDKNRYKERFGKSKNNLDLSKKIIWIHAASIGEFKSSELIINKYHSNFHILITTTTKSSAEYINKFYKDKILHQYIPFDISIWCSRFLNNWKPNLVLWIESDIWPNMLNQIKKRNINCLFINARVSPKSFNKWKYIKNLYSSSLRTFIKIFAQSQNDLMRIKKLTKLKIEYIGNMKLSKNKNVDINRINEDKNKYAVMLISSHENEEELVIKQIVSIIKNKKLKLYIAPRHPERISEIIEILNKYNLEYSLESTNNIINNVPVTIIDSFGKLNKYFQMSQLVILGGSFVNKGGHNPLEPANYKCAIISGNLVYNWQNIYEDMLKENACIIIDDINNLKFKFNEIISDKVMLEEYKMNAFNFSKKKFFEKERLFEEIDLVLK